jgi:hypothetical protein
MAAAQPFTPACHLKVRNSCRRLSRQWGFLAASPHVHGVGQLHRRQHRSLLVRLRLSSTLLGLVKQRPFLLTSQAGESKATAVNPHENRVGSRGLVLLLMFLGLGKQRPFLLVSQAGESKLAFRPPLFIVGAFHPRPFIVGAFRSYPFIVHALTGHGLLP